MHIKWHIKQLPLKIALRLVIISYPYMVIAYLIWKYGYTLFGVFLGCLCLKLL